MNTLFTANELSEMLNFVNEHLKKQCDTKKNAKNNTLGFTIHQSWDSGIGVSTFIKCDCCGESKCVTDYEVW